jgi:HlyD family secretion protein
MVHSHKRPGRGWETLIAVVAALAAGGAGGYLIADRGGPSSTSANPNAAKPDRITALARLQPAGGVIPVFGPPGDRIAEMRDVAPGMQLEAKQEIALLASRAERLEEVAVAETQQQEAKTAQKYAEVAGNQKVNAARAELSQAKANKASDLAALEARRKFLELQAASAARQVQRLEELQAGKVTVSAEEMDKVKLLQAQADAELAAANATIEKTRITYEETEKAAEARIAAALAELDEAVARVPIKSSEEKLALARMMSENTIIKAPVAGTVLKVTGRPGQPTGMEPILQMADLTTMTAVAEVYESDVDRLFAWVDKGPVKAELKNPALPRPLSGVVQSRQDISRMIARNQVFAVGPREDADRRVVEVTIHLDPAAAADAGRFVGLQVTATLEPNK